MSPAKEAIELLHRHVGSAIDLQERANATNLDEIAVVAVAWQEMMVQCVVDLLIDSRQSYLDPSRIVEDPNEIRKALTLIGERTLLDMDWRDPNTAFVLGQVSRAAGRALLNM